MNHSVYIGSILYFSVSYIPVTQNNSYDVPPVMARRDLHGDYRAYGSSNSVFSSPSRFISNVRSQIMNGYSAIRDRLTHHNSQQEAPPPPILNSPTSQHSTRFSRTSSQSSTNGSTTTGYNLRRRAPIHSTPRDNNAEQRQTTIQERQSQNNNNDEFHLEKEDKIEIDNENILINSIKSMLYSLKNLHKIISLPWWLIIFLLLVGIYVGKLTIIVLISFFFFFLKFLILHVNPLNIIHNQNYIDNVKILINIKLEFN